MGDTPFAHFTEPSPYGGAMAAILPPMDFDLSLDDMILSAYRLSWPAPATKPASGGVRRVLRRAVEACRPQRLEGWPVALSVPARQ